MAAKKPYRVAVFGVFDRLHPGHLYLLYHARILGDELVAILARGETVKKFKGHAPHDSERTRLRKVRDTKLVTKAVLGDKEQGNYEVLKKIKPDIIAVGYDQKELLKDIKSRIQSKELPKIKMVKLKAYKPQKHHTSLLK
jgi:FAD synthetase